MRGDGPDDWSAVARMGGKPSYLTEPATLNEMYGKYSSFDEAFESDGEKLRQLTGEDHGPFYDDDGTTHIGPIAIPVRGPFTFPIDQNSAYPVDRFAHLNDLPSLEEKYPAIHHQRQQYKAGTLFTATIIVEKSEQLHFAVLPGEEPHEALQRYCRETGVTAIIRHSEPRKA